jgi:beta-glucosidase
VLLAGGVNLTRDPRNGRTFEYLSEDPLLSGVLVGAAIRGIQSNHIISTIKHFALNGQETGRQVRGHPDRQGRRARKRPAGVPDRHRAGPARRDHVRLQPRERPARLRQRLAAQHRAQARLGLQGLRHVGLGRGAGLEAATAGLDQQSGEQLDKAVYFGSKLADKAATDKAWAARSMT